MSLDKEKIKQEIIDHLNIDGEYPNIDPKKLFQELPTIYEKLVEKNLIDSNEITLDHFKLEAQQSYAFTKMRSDMGNMFDF